ncbi:RluA family pseudouridine synthase [Lichenihabitans sp. Uapishka_5]|uniref:RluA family pseudouridine synthase n=1 Tax=Lichenihabitans sp. Uapishka_5 TaxID=3037302 RepID=UPI0029E80035|nr:RluA family pseudouridine synthase [Lichenihabitans sp. Uapishka_5]MDX7952278.1 RluA family pseudouridine synthase [Lichenihabitans sp. Uapishka_5]
MSVETLTVASEEDGMRLDRWFKRRVPALSLAHLNKIVRTGQVRVDGGRVKVSTRLGEGQLVRVPPLSLDPAEAPEIARSAPVRGEADRRALTDMILFEDRDLIVLNKPYGLAVQGGSGTRQHIDGMLEALTDQRGNRPLLVHRLDKDTSGVLLVARNRKIAADLGHAFRSRQAQKVYWSLLEGVPKPGQGRISLFLAKGDGMGTTGRSGPRTDAERATLEKMRVAKHGDADAQHSVTLYSVVDKVAPRLAWVSMKPITGRTHQLRAHAEAIGHPMVGDPKYTGGVESKPRRMDPLRAIPGDVEPKLHLLARRLVLPHPGGGTIDVSAPLPPHMQKSWDLFGFDVATRDPIEDAPE